MPREIIESESVLTTQKVAINLAKSLGKNATIALYGNLGAGKTLFASALITALVGDKNINVTSPTFNIVQNYVAADGTKIYHFDLYRLQESGELHEIGVGEALESGISIIEWPEIIESDLPENTVYIKITHQSDEGSRKIEIVT